MGAFPVRCFAAALALSGLLVVGVTSPVAAASGPNPAIAALQITMRSRLLYRGPVTGVSDERTALALRALQRRLGLPADGIFGPQTRSRLFPLGTPVLGARLLTLGSKGYDVALLRVELALHGFPSGRFSTLYTPRTARAVLRFQRWAGLPQTAMAGPLTAGALRAPPAVSPEHLAWPVCRRARERLRPARAAVSTPGSTSSLRWRRRSPPPAPGKWCTPAGVTAAGGTR